MKSTTFTQRRLKMSKTLEDIISYEKQALDLLPMDHPHYEEIRRLLIDQVNDEIQDYANTSPN
jgi:hypothetical protein